MTENNIHTGEILFIKCVKDGIPNRDPLRDSDARRLFGPDDGRISLSDVSIKRDVRDYVLARYPDGGPDRQFGVFVRREESPDGGVLLGREGLALSLLERFREGRSSEEATSTSGGGRKRSGGGDANLERDLLSAAFDFRIFGAVFSVKKQSFNRVGPVQFGWAHSLHPVETKYVQGTVCMPSRDTKPSEEGEEAKGPTQGTIWTMYHLPFALFAMPGVINRSIAEQTGMSRADLELLLEGLWKGTLHRQARGRGRQQPLFLLHVEYKDPFFRLGFLEEGVSLEPGRQEWQGGQPPTDLNAVKLNVEALGERLRQHNDQILRARLWHEPQLQLVGDLSAERVSWPVVSN